VELYRSNRFKQKSKTEKGLSDLMKKQTSNLKKLTAIYLALRHFLPLIKKSKYKKILIRMDNTVVMYNINRKSGQ
jgi:ribonuclease HI